MDCRRWIKRKTEKMYPNSIRIILVGSRAKGEHRPQSDWDVVVVIPNAWRPEPGVKWPVIAEKLVAPDGNEVEIVESTPEDLDHPGRFMSDLRTWGVEL